MLSAGDMLRYSLLSVLYIYMIKEWGGNQKRSISITRCNLIYFWVSISSVYYHVHMYFAQGVPLVWGILNAYALKFNCILACLSHLCNNIMISQITFHRISSLFKQFGCMDLGTMFPKTTLWSEILHFGMLGQ